MYSCIPSITKHKYIVQYKIELILSTVQYTPEVWVACLWSDSNNLLSLLWQGIDRGQRIDWFVQRIIYWARQSFSLKWVVILLNTVKYFLRSFYTIRSFQVCNNFGATIFRILVYITIWIFIKCNNWNFFVLLKNIKYNFGSDRSLAEELFDMRREKLTSRVSEPKQDSKMCLVITRGALSTAHDDQ